MIVSCFVVLLLDKVISVLFGSLCMILCKVFVEIVVVFDCFIIVVVLLIILILRFVVWNDIFVLFVLISILVRIGMVLWCLIIDCV